MFELSTTQWFFLGVAAALAVAAACILLGACMVSGEGACSAFYQYGGNLK